MLPAYGANRMTSFFFLIYMTLGLFLFMNLMLAIIYNSYQDRTEQQMDDKALDRTYYFT